MTSTPVPTRVDFPARDGGRYRDAGLTDITLGTYPGARHVVLNETNRAEVINNLLRWLDRALGTE